MLTPDLPSEVPPTVIRAFKLDVPAGYILHFYGTGYRIISIDGNWQEACPLPEECCDRAWRHLRGEIPAQLGDGSILRFEQRGMFEDEVKGASDSERAAGSAPLDLEAT